MGKVMGKRLLVTARHISQARLLGNAWAATLFAGEGDATSPEADAQKVQEVQVVKRKRGIIPGQLWYGYGGDRKVAWRQAVVGAAREFTKDWVFEPNAKDSDVA